MQEFFLDNHSVESVIERNPNQPFPLIKELVLATEVSQNEIEDKFRDALEEDEDADCTDLAEKVDALSAYQEYLKKTAQCAFVKQRAEMLEGQMRNKYKDMDPDPIKVFSVSSSLYIDWMKKRRREDPVLTPEMTGIPKLRQFLLGISADANLEAYREHVASTLPNFLGKIARITDHENKNDAYAEIRPFFNELLDGLKEAHELSFSN